MKLLITGGCGFLGSNLALAALEKKYQLIVLDNLYRTGAEKNLTWLKSQGNFKFVHSDVRNREDVEVIIKEEKPTAIFHLAGQVAMTTSIANPRLDFEINALGTFNILDAVRKFSPESTVIYSSTNKVYGDLEFLKYEEISTRYILSDFQNGLPENIPLEFCSPYGCSKGAADQYMIDFYKSFGIKTVVFRHSSMYGGRQFATYDQGWIGWFCYQALLEKYKLQTEPFTISGNGKQVRDVLYADDMVSLYFTALEHIEKIKGTAFNIGGGTSNSLSLLELFDILEQELDIKLKYNILPHRNSDQKVFIADIAKISNLTNWMPLVDKENGIKKMLNWLKSIM